ncbi:hypothetical protein Cgig2_012517 [Carnegiea gigantea]|uniref:hAT-like transposase RNase-H fold domain-containing protein n=1 Tax=Carnegiea gigantea TaxID=171969 RepID=A0A9Q1H0A9_9CARY|nr:hypothetical protein Cgig2_012517 [Carnegiea gigantea]
MTHSGEATLSLSRLSHSSSLSESTLPRSGALRPCITQARLCEILGARSLTVSGVHRRLRRRLSLVNYELPTGEATLSLSRLSHSSSLSESTLPRSGALRPCVTQARLCEILGARSLTVSGVHRWLRRRLSLVNYEPPTAQQISMEDHINLEEQSNASSGSACPTKTNMEQVKPGDMALQMHKKVDDYYGDWAKTNLMVLIAVVFDPHYKLKIVRFSFRKLYPNDFAKSDRVYDNLYNVLKRLYGSYSSCVNVDKDDHNGSSSPIHADHSQMSLNNDTLKELYS